MTGGAVPAATLVFVLSSTTLPHVLHSPTAILNPCTGAGGRIPVQEPADAHPQAAPPGSVLPAARAPFVCRRTLFCDTGGSICACVVELRCRAPSCPAAGAVSSRHPGLDLQPRRLRSSQELWGSALLSRLSCVSTDQTSLPCATT